MYFFSCRLPRKPGGGGYSLYVLPYRVGFLRRFGLKTGIQFTHFGLESGIVFEGTTDSGMNVRKKEKYEHSKWI